MRARRARACAALAALVAFAALATGCGAAAARPLTVEDVLRVEGLGQAAASPDGRWLLLERRRAYVSAARFDLGLYTDLFRTRLEVVDLDAPGPPRPLFPQESGVGYALGPVAPDGRRVAVFRLKDDAWELGIADPRAAAVAWTGLAPELLEQGRAVAWADADTLLVIALPPGLLPLQLRLHAPARALPSRWAATAEGRASVTAAGSGRLRAARPQDPPSRLVALEVAAGAARILAEGRFEDLELSAGGRWAALLEAGEDIALDAARPIQGPYGLARQRMRLRLVDLAAGRALSPCLRCDLIGSLLAWSPAADELLVFARRDGEPWTDGRLLRVSPSGTVAEVAGEALAPVVGGRPETVRAGWLGAAPLVYARPRGGPGGRADWWRVGPDGATRLTGGLAAPPPAGLAVASGRLVLVADGRGHAIDAGGRTVAATPPGLRPPPLPPGPPYPRFGRTLLEAPALAATVGTGADEGRGAAVIELGPDGPAARWPAPEGAEVLAHAPGRGALVRAPLGAADRLLWVDGRGLHPLATLNAAYADLDAPDLRPVRHAGPDGRPLTSWLMLPAAARTGRPPPLVIWPYPGRAYGEAPPEILHPRHGLAEAQPRLLAAHGYAVLLPSLPPPAGDAAPSDDMAERLLAVVAAAAAQPGTAGTFDPDRLGLWGHSFGGYAVLAAVTQSDRFAAAVASAAMPNLLAKWGDLAPRRYWPQKGLSDPGWTEDLQGDTRGPPWATTDRFLRGSPLLQMDRARTPLLLLHGELDNFALLGAEQAFSAYLRQDRDAVLATYWGEPHVLRSPGNIRDAFGRALAFLDARLGLTPPPAAPTPGSAPANDGPRPPPPRRAAGEARRPAR